MKFYNTFFVFIVSLAAAALNWSCQVVALGPKLDLEAPRLTITRPAFAEVVLEEFELAGTVTDNVKPTRLTVNIEKVSREWKNSQGTWQTREKPESPWQPCAGTWNVNGTSVNWSLSVSLAGISPGDYVIVVNSFDEFSNNDAHSVQRVKITCYNENPFFTVLNPVLKTGTDNRIPQVLEDMDDHARLNPALIGELYNKSVSVDYEISGGDFSRGGNLTIYLAGPPPSATAPIAGNIWYEKTIPVSKRIGSITISHAEIKNSAGGQPASGRTPLQIISRLTDSQMKEEYKSSGWFMWWPESDRPWVVFSAGSDPGADPYTKLYESGENTVYAYDDDGVASLWYRVYRWNRASRQTEGKPAAEGTVPFKDNQSEWFFTIPGTPGDYRIEAVATDTHGISGDTGYAYITAIKRPSMAYKFLTRISSSNTDGMYKAGDRVNILLDFDVPIIVDGKPKLKLNIEAGSSGDRYAEYSSGSPGKTLYFTYTMQDGDHTPGTNPLDLTAIDTSGGDFSFTDAYGDKININGEIKFPDAAYLLAQQKKIYVVHGKPAVSSIGMADGVLTVQFDWKENTSFPWSLVRGSGDLTMEIEKNDYRIPSVIPKARYEELEIDGYTDKDSKPYYELTINGAFDDGRTDTDPKYVLRFDLDTAGFGAASQQDTNLRDAIRNKEKIVLSAYSSQVTVSSHTLAVNVSSFQPLKGVKYNLIISKGFLTDSLARIDSDEVTSTVLSPGVEKPFFRIEKNDEEIFGNGDAMQAHQPAVARVKLDCRTPGAEIYYTDPAKTASFTVDPVENYLLEQSREPDNKYYLVPSPKPAETGVLNSTVKAKPPVWRERPHPGKLPNPHTPAKPPSADPEGRTETYKGTPFKIGSNNYALGGMAYRLTAVAYFPNSGNISSEPSCEVAYRSVLVFNNTEPPPGTEYTTRLDGAGGSGIFKFPAPYADGKRVRIWIMGGDSAAGSVLTPGFPLSWNAGEYDKVRLMTPIGRTGVTGGGSGKYSAVGDHKNNASGVVETTLTDNKIPSSYDTSGTYTWYWITWKLGNAAYVQFQRRVLIDSGSRNPPFDIRDPYISNLKQGWNDYKDYYPVFPGETRVVNPTTPYWYRDTTAPQQYLYYKLLGKRDSSTRWHPLS